MSTQYESGTIAAIRAMIQPMFPGCHLTNWELKNAHARLQDAGYYIGKRLPEPNQGRILKSYDDPGGESRAAIIEAQETETEFQQN